MIDEIKAHSGITNQASSKQYHLVMQGRSLRVRYFGGVLRHNQ